MAVDGALLVLRNSEQTREWPLAELTELLIGRDPECAISLPDRSVSRYHAELRRDGEGYVIEDRGSKNGTFVNGEPIDEPTSLKDGDEISIAARYKLFFVDADATAPIVFERRGLRIDPETMTVYVGGKPIDPPLSGPQFELLQLLCDASGSIVGRDDIVTHVWPDEDAGGVSEDALDALVRRLRLRLADLDPEHQYIVTVRGYGFRIEEP